MYCSALDVVKTNLFPSPFSQEVALWLFGCVAGTGAGWAVPELQSQLHTSPGSATGWCPALQGGMLEMIKDSDVNCSSAAKNVFCYQYVGAALPVPGVRLALPTCACLVLGAGQGVD